MSDLSMPCINAYGMLRRAGARIGLGSGTEAA